MNKIECTHFSFSESFGGCLRVFTNIYVYTCKNIHLYPRPLPTFRQIKYISTRNLVRMTRMTDRDIK